MVLIIDVLKSKCLELFPSRAHNLPPVSYIDPMQTMCETLGVVLCCAHATRKAVGTARSSVRRDQGNSAPLEANGQKLIKW
jgi:hypothetical protein